MRELEEEHALFHHKSSSSQLSLPLPGTVNSIASADSHESEPIIPLSPDPFGRYPSSQDFIGSTGSSVTYWEPESRPSLSIDSTGTAADLPPRSESVATSRFSLDTVPDEEITQPPTKQNGAKSTFGAITKLWKKGSKTPISQSHPPPPPTPTVTTYAGRISSEIPPRPSQDRLDTPTSSAGFTTPTTPTFGRLSVQPTPPPQAPLMSHLPAALQAGRPSMDSLNVPQQHAPQQSSPLHSHPRPGQPLMNANGSGVSPRLSTRSLGYDQLHFDQESPYPFRRYTPQSSSTPVSSTVTLPHTDHAPATPALSSSPTNDKPSSTNGIRKNLLKGWKSGSSSSVSSASGDHEPSRLSLDKPGRPRKGSVLHYSASPEPIPPSPQIPEQFLQRKTSDSRQPPQMVANNKPRMNSASTGGQAPRSSFASSDSGETRPSFDVSQFEIVSPRNVGYAT
ncbi:hypothetical protein AX16_000463 [Volvariella volvacea WC 439]|nr:hypothetical protein AX16_000463 [Volvariella volvacea WC 439]